MFIDPHDDALRRFTEDKIRLRKLARINGMCTRCIVRRALQGKAYCQRCTDYAKRHARKRKYQKPLNSAGETYPDKIMRMADYGFPGGSTPTAMSEPDPRGFVRKPGPLPHRRDEHVGDFTRAGPLGAAVPLRNSIPTPVGLNPMYGETEGD